MIEINHHDEVMKIIGNIPPQFLTTEIMIIIAKGYVAEKGKDFAPGEFEKVFVAHFAISKISRFGKDTINPKDQEFILSQIFNMSKATNTPNEKIIEDQKKETQLEQVLEERSREKPIEFVRRMSPEEVDALKGSKNLIRRFAKKHEFNPGSFYNTFQKFHNS